MQAKNYEDDPRLTALALGELEGEERAAIEALVAEDPGARRVVDEIHGMADALSRELATETFEGPALSGEQRAGIERAFAKRRRPLARPPWFVPAAVAASALAAIGSWTAWCMLQGESAFTYSLFGDDAPATADLAKAPPAPEREYVGFELRDKSVNKHEPTWSLMQGETKKNARRELERLKGLAYSGGDGDEPDAGGLSREGYDQFAENPFVRVAQDPLSTFSIDVDTASYANVRRFLRNGQLPPAAAVRVEELVNYFRYDYPEPASGRPFSVSVEVAGCPWNEHHRLVRIGLKGRSIDAFERRPSNLVFLVDVSGSMNDESKLPLLKKSLRLLVDNLNDKDRVAIVVYAGAAGLVLPSTPASQKAAILAALEELQAGGSTAGGAGIRLAYDVAQQHFIEGGTNRVILATDGDFNVGTSSDGELVALVEEKRRSGVELSVLGFGTGNLQDSKLEKLADHGNGNYGYVDSLAEAQKLLVQEMGATLETIAKDVKIQVELNPAEVEAFRLIGYENRVLAHQDFKDDAKDAGEIGAGHTVTALYEIVPKGLPVPGVPKPDPLTYQRPSELSGASASGELCTVKLRYKPPGGETSSELRVPVVDAGYPIHAASPDMKLASAVAAFGMLLRGSEHRGAMTLADVAALARAGQGADPHGYRAELLELVNAAALLSVQPEER